MTVYVKALPTHLIWVPTELGITCAAAAVADEM